MTCDEVARSLSRQEALLANLLHKLQRGSALVAVDSSKLQDVRQRVARSLSDKVGLARSGPQTAENVSKDDLPQEACASSTRGLC